MLWSCSAGKMAMKKGDKRFQYGEYDYSIEYFQNAIAKGYNAAEANYKIGESYRLSNRVKQAVPYYQAAIEANYPDEAVHLYYSQALKANEQYNQAQAALQSYLDGASDQQMTALAEQELDNLQKVEKLAKQESFFRVKNLEEINTTAADYGPAYREGELYFTSAREADKIYKATGTGFTDLYKVKTQGAIVDVNSVTALSDVINDEGVNEGCIAFSPDGQTMVFAKGNNGRLKGADDVDLYISRNRRGGWSAPTVMRLNDDKAWDSTPSFSFDGRTLYFSSNRRGGVGGTDLYAATMNRRGNFSNVRNLGPVINTAGNEMFPFQAEDGSLYFASNGHPSLGGLDILVARRSEGKMVVENPGPPINSSADDFGIHLFRLDRGFFSSNREGGKGDDDIYTFINNDPDLKIVNYFLTGTTFSIDEDDKETILPGTSVKLFGADDEMLNEALSDREGRFIFRVFPEEDYRLLAEKPDYFTTRASFSTKGKSIPKDELTQLVTNKTFDTKIVLDQIVLDRAIVLENIYYDLDKADIRPDAAQELDKLVAILQDNPEIKIELSSHTDSRATADYNLDLSKRRAQSAVNYIVSKDIDRSRLTAKGYGESEPIIPDEEIEKLPTEERREEAHQRNRRTEFKVIEYNRVDEPEPLADDEEYQNEETVELQAEEVVEQPAKGSLEEKIDWDN